MPTPSQPAILAPTPGFGRFLTFRLDPAEDFLPALTRLQAAAADLRAVVGLGQPLVRALGATVPGLRPFPGLCGPAITYPSTQGALWTFLGGEAPGDVLDRGRALQAMLAEGFVLEEDVDAFTYRGGRDLTGYVDGTENPVGDAALDAAFVAGQGDGLDGGTFVHTQKWVHDLARFESLPRAAQDATIGRARDTNRELAEAPPSAHVKRTAQESFSPPAFMVRRSMPWGGVEAHGLYFVGYARELERFERVLSRMAGIEDGVVDALQGFSRAVTGGWYWCPPLRDGRLDLRAVGVDQ